MSETDTNTRFETETLLIGRWSEAADPGTGDAVPLTGLPERYNIVVVAGERGRDAMPDFRPARFTGEEFRAQVDALHADGRTVLLAIGGPHARVELRDGQEEALFERIIELTDTFGFDGVVLELAPDDAAAAGNLNVISAALLAARLHYGADGDAFRIGVTAGDADPDTGERPVPFLRELDGHCDFVVRDDGLVSRAA
ncbi:hypothetical protein ACWIGI_33910 [Nocardia sp. NPDC055321]